MAVRITTDQIHELEAELLPGHERDLAALGEHLADGGVDVGAVISEIRRFSVAAPSWALGTGGTRFGRFPRGGEPRTTDEKLDDIAALDSLTGANDTVSLHVPWDDPDDPAAAARVRRRARHRVRRDELEHVPGQCLDHRTGRVVQVRLARPLRCRRPQAGARAQPRRDRSR